MATTSWTLVVTGAGFSVNAGFPVTSGIWHAADEWPNSSFAMFGRSINPREQLDLADYILHRELKLLKEPLRECDPEEVFVHLRRMMPKSAWVYGSELHRRLSRSDDVDSSLYVAYKALEYVFFEVLGRPYEDLLEYVSEQPRPFNYDAYLGSAAQLAEHLPRFTCIVSTNYDDVWELALNKYHKTWTYGCPVGYHSQVERFGYTENTGSYLFRGFSSLNRPEGLVWSRSDWRPSGSWADADIYLCEVHGSARWLQCRDCSAVYALDFWSAFVTSFLHEGDDDPITRDNLRFRCWDLECAFIPRIPIMLPVTEKDPDIWAIRQQWSSAWVAARSCRGLFLCGTSLRESDVALCRLVRTAAKHADTVVVVNPSQNALDRVTSIVGRGVRWAKSLDELLDWGIL
jgi:NAD-dependent SIR2 family protein deacetylase